MPVLLGKAEEAQEGAVGVSAMVPETTTQALDTANHLERELERWQRKARKLGEFAARVRRRDIEEAAPDCGWFHGRVVELLAKRGWKNVEARTEW